MIQAETLSKASAMGGKASGALKTEDSAATIPFGDSISGVSTSTEPSSERTEGLDVGRSSVESAGDQDRDTKLNTQPSRSSALSFPSMTSGGNSSQSLSTPNIFANTGPMPDHLNDGGMDPSAAYSHSHFGISGRHPGLDAIDAAQYASPLSITTPSESLRSLLEHGGSGQQNPNNGSDQFSASGLESDDSKQHAAAAAAAAAYMQQRMDMAAAVASSGTLSPTHPAFVYYHNVGMMGYNPSTMTMGRDGQPAYFFGQPHAMGMAAGFDHPMYHHHALAYHMAQQQSYHPHLTGAQHLQANQSHGSQSSSSLAGIDSESSTDRRSSAAGRKPRASKPRTKPAGSSSSTTLTSSSVSGSEGTSKPKSKLGPALVHGSGPSYRQDGSPPTFEEIARYSYPSFDELFTLLQSRANYEGFVLIKNTKAVNRKFIQCDRAGTRNVSRTSSSKKNDDGSNPPKIRHRMTKKCGCPFRVNLNYSPEYCWHVTKISPHHNHPMMNTSFARGPGVGLDHHGHHHALHSQSSESTLSGQTYHPQQSQSSIMSDGQFVHDAPVSGSFAAEPSLNLICE